MSSDPLKSFLAGWAGGLGNLAVGHPFDTVKTMMQNAQPGTYRNSLSCVIAIVRNEGPLALYKGVTAPMAGIGAVFALYFLAFSISESAIRRILNLGKDAQLSMPCIIVAGGSTGVMGSLVLGPAELLKIRQQTAIQSGRPGGFADVAKGVWADGGPRGFTRGLGATMVRDVPGSMAWFGTYEMVKRMVCKDPKTPSVGEALLAGGCGGVAMWSFALPLDSIKTRMQAVAQPTGEGAAVRRGYLETTRHIFAVSGVGGFYRGVGPALLRAFPANAACFAAREMAAQGLDILW